MLGAGSRCLSIFTHALNARVLRAYEKGPLSYQELDRVFGWAPQSSLRAALNSLRDLGAIQRLEGGTTAPGGPHALTAAGHDLLPVAGALERWLEQAPEGPVSLEDTAAFGTIRVLIAGWDSTVVRELAEEPQTLVQLSAKIPGTTYPALKRRLSKLRSTQMVVPVKTPHGTAYEASEWLREAVAPFVLAGRWERRHDAEAIPISRVEVEAAFLLTLPLIELPARSSGACALAVLTPQAKDRTERNTAGVTVEIERGKLASCSTATSAQGTWALGSIDAWLDATIDGNADSLRFNGANPRLAENIVKGVHDALFPSRATRDVQKTRQASMP